MIKITIRKETNSPLHIDCYPFMKSRALGPFLSLLLLCSCATERPIRPELPHSVTMNKDAGRSGWLIVTLRLESGEKLPFVIDTGTSGVLFDKSLEPKLGTRLGTEPSWNFGVKRAVDIYAAPRLYLAGTPLMMTGNVATFDFKQLPLSRPIMGILGMDCLQHYCLQLDFNAGKMRFLDDEHSNKEAWGKPFPLTGLGDGCFSVRENLAGVKDSGSLIDTGCNYDGWLSPQSFQQWTNQAQAPASGEVRSPKGVLGGETYPDIDLHGLDAKLFASGDMHITVDGIGLHFLARHLVTFDFPKQTLYLKRTSIGPLIDKNMAAAGAAAVKSTVKFLSGLRRKGQLLGWSITDEEPARSVHFYFHYPDSVTCDDLLKKSDSSIYHYEVARSSKGSPWQLHKAWRTDQNGHTIEEYPIH